jgi:hypothetical protein
MEPVSSNQPSEALLKQTLNQNGENLFDLSHKNPLLLIFLRHFG